MSHCREGDMHLLQVKVGPRDSALHNGTIARELIKLTLLPKDVEERGRLPVSEVLQSFFPHLVQVMHDATTLRATVTHYADMSASLQSQVKEMAEREARAKEKDARATVELLKLREESAGLREENTKLREENSRLHRENRSTLAALSSRDSQLGESEELAADRLTQLQKTLGLLEAMTIKSKAAEGSAAMAEGRVSVAEKWATAAEGRAVTAESQLAAAEEKVTRAVAAAAQAVEDYKDSDEFEEDAATACINLFDIGYAACLDKIKRAHPDLDLGNLAVLTSLSQPTPPAECGGREGAPPEEEVLRLEDARRGEEPPPAEETSLAGDKSEGNAAAVGEPSVAKQEVTPRDEGPRNDESGVNASEPIIVESPEPGQG